MALDYSLDIETSLSPQEALPMLANYLNLEWEDIERPNLFAAGIKIFAWQTTEHHQAIISEYFNFRSTLYVSFRLHAIDSDIEDEQRKQIMLKAVLKLLEHSTGNALMLFNGETIVLQRFAGKLTLNKSWNSLFSNNKNLFSKLDYELCDLPSPLL